VLGIPEDRSCGPGENIDWPICGIGGVPVVRRELDRVEGAEPEPLVDAKMAERDGLERRNGRLKSVVSRVGLSAALSGLRKRGSVREGSEFESGGDTGGLSSCW